MDNAIGNVLHFVTDAGKSISTRLAIVFLAIIFLFVLDHLSGFTYNMQTNHKLNQLEKIAELKTTYMANSVRVAQLRLIEEQTMNRENYLVSFFSLFDTGSNAQRNADQITQKPIASTNNSIRNIYWMIVSSSYGLILLMMMLLLTPFFALNDLKGVVAGSLVVMVMLVFTISAITFIAYFIPVIDKTRPYINYIVNGVIHAGFLLLALRWIRRSA